MPVVPITNAVLVALASLTFDNVDWGVVKSITTLAFLKIDDALYMGPYWRIRDQGNQISFQYYNVDSDEWITAIPFFSS